MLSTAVLAVVVLVLVILPELILLTLGCKSDEITVTDSQGSTIECIPCQQCLEGFELYPKCGSTITKKQKEQNHIECRACKPGYFSDKLDVYPCKECHHCLNSQPVIKECTNMSDTVCGDKCGIGRYLEKSSLDCQLCSCCCGDSKDIKISKCINDNKPATYHCTSHRRQECCKTSTVKTPTVSARGSGDKGSKLTVGIIIGIIIGVLTVIVGIIFVLRYYLKRKRQGARERPPTKVQFNGTPTDTCKKKEESGHQTKEQSSTELRVVLPPYEQASGSGDAKQNRLSNTAFDSSQPGTPDLHVKEFKEKIESYQPPQPRELKKQLSTSSGSDKTELQRKRNGSVSSIVSGISRKFSISLRQGSFDEESLVSEENVHLPENQIFKLSDLDLCETETVGKMLDNPGYSVNSTKQLATSYKMKKLDIQELAKESKHGEKVLAFINAKYPNLTVYEFCRTLGKQGRNDIIEELSDYLHRRETQPASPDNKSYV